MKTHLTHLSYGRHRTFSLQNRKLRRYLLLAGSSFVCLTASTAYGAGTPAEVTVRVEGADATLVTRAKVMTTAAEVNKDGQAGHVCSGTSALGALNLATNGEWAGDWNAMFKAYFITGIKGVKPAMNQFWAFWHNNKSAMTGLCDTELAQGDEILLFPDCFGVGCVNPKPLKVNVAEKAAVGEQISLKVVHYEADGSEIPEAGVDINIAGKTVQTDTGGNASLKVDQQGDFEVTAQKPGFVRDSGRKLCVYPQQGGACGVPVGSCGRSIARCIPPTTPDNVAPQLTVSISNGKTFTRKRAPHLLTGSVQDADPKNGNVSGIRQFALHIQRKNGKQCTFLHPKKEQFVKTKCGRQHEGDYLGVEVKNNRWSYLLPKKLAAGTYQLRLRATDNANNTARKTIRFRVK